LRGPEASSIGIKTDYWSCMTAFVKGSDDNVDLLVDSAALTTPSPKKQGIGIYLLYIKNPSDFKINTALLMIQYLFNCPND
jgi:hypothetical protein